MTQTELAFATDGAFTTDGYPPGFHRWITTKEGQRVWLEFEKRALQMANVRKRYGAQSIIEVIRWDTSIADGGAEFKINNNWVAGLARYWLEKHGVAFPGFFELRS